MNWQEQFQRVISLLSLPPPQLLVYASDLHTASSVRGAPLPPHHQQGAIEGRNFASVIYKPKTKAKDLSFRKKKETGKEGKRGKEKRSKGRDGDSKISSSSILRYCFTEGKSKPDFLKALFEG